MMHPRRRSDSGGAGFVAPVSARALIMRLPTLRSGAHDGTRPHRNVPSRRVPRLRDSATASTGSVGATFHRGSRSSSRATSSPLNNSANNGGGDVDVKRPHIRVGKLPARPIANEWEGKLTDER